MMYFRCTVAAVEVPSSTGQGAYTVTLDENGERHCTCPAYKYHGHCRHQGQAQFCLWNEYRDGGTAVETETGALVCPRCGGPALAELWVEPKGIV